MKSASAAASDGMRCGRNWIVLNPIRRTSAQQEFLDEHCCAERLVVHVALDKERAFIGGDDQVWAGRKPTWSPADVAKHRRYLELPKQGPVRGKIPVCEKGCLA